jgi:probable phosphoglycerate mutase
LRRNAAEIEYDARVSTGVPDRRALTRSTMQQPTTIILCRHGESEGNRDARFGGHSPTPLTELGRSQALATGHRLSAAGGVDVVFSSDLPRALETAELIASATGASRPRVTPLLRERSVGIFTGLTFAEAQARFPNDYEALLRRDPDSCPPGGETYMQCRNRASDFMERVIAEHPGQRVLFVSHHLTLFQLVLHILDVESVAQPRFYVKIDNCALHRFERYPDGVWQVLAFNDAAHLAR